MSEPESMAINLTERDSDGGRITIREVALGLHPLILIEPSLEGSDGCEEVVIDIDYTDLDQAGLVSMLRVLADAIEVGTEVERA